jgi:hypothetical protein
VNLEPHELPGEPALHRQVVSVRTREDCGTAGASLTRDSASVV